MTPACFAPSGDSGIEWENMNIHTNFGVFVRLGSHEIHETRLFLSHGTDVSVGSLCLEMERNEHRSSSEFELENTY